MTKLLQSILIVLGFVLAAAMPALAAREMLFEVNEGQAQPGVQFLARTHSYTLLLKRSDATLIFTGAKDQALTMKFAGSRQNVAVSGLDASTAKMNYFSGPEDSWKRDIGAYRRVRYASLYRGIDLGFYGRGGQLEYDFVVKPGSDPGRIAINLQGSGQPSIAKNGDLVITAGGREVRFLAPVAYQTSGRSIAAKYVLRDGGAVGFSIGAYDHSKTLVIDPVVTYSSFLGGSDDEGIFGIERDREGNIYVAGETSSLNFPSRNPVQTQEAGDYDAFVSKFDPTGTHLIYSTYLGGSSYDHAIGLAVDERGEAYVAGVTQSANFPVKNAVQATLKGSQNAFAAHLTKAGSDLVFSTYLGGSRYDGAQGVAIDRERNMYVAGGTSSIDFPVTAGAFQTVCDGPNAFPGFCGSDSFITKIAPDGSRLLYSTFLGGQDYDGANGIVVDRRGAAYITGGTNSPDYPILKPFQSKLASPGIQNAFLTKLDPTGSKLEFSTYFGGTGGETGNAVALGSRGEVYVAGVTISTDMPTVKPFQSTNHGGFTDCFVAKFSRDGETLLRSSYFGGSGWDFPFKVAVDAFDSASVIGFTTSTDLATAHAVQSGYGGGNTDGFVLKLLPESFAPLYSTYLGGSGDEFGYGLYSEDWGAVWIGGSTTSTTFPVLKGYQAIYGGGPFDAFLTRLALTVPDYLRILRDLLEGNSTAPELALTELKAAQQNYEDGNMEAVASHLERLAVTIGPQRGNEMAAALSGTLEMLKAERAVR